MPCPYGPHNTPKDMQIIISIAYAALQWALTQRGNTRGWSGCSSLPETIANGQAQGERTWVTGRIGGLRRLLRPSRCSEPIMLDKQHP